MAPPAPANWDIAATAIAAEFGPKAWPDCCSNKGLNVVFKFNEAFVLVILEKNYNPEYLSKTMKTLVNTNVADLLFDDILHNNAEDNVWGSLVGTGKTLLDN